MVTEISLATLDLVDCRINGNARSGAASADACGNHEVRGGFLRRQCWGIRLDQIRLD